MTVMYLSAIALILLIFCPTYYTRVTKAYVKEMRSLENELTKLGLMKEEGESEIAKLSAKEDELQSERISLVETTYTMPSLGGKTGSKTYNNPLEYLVGSGRITKDDVEKAKKYKAGSGSQYNLGEILVMMDTISSADLKLAQQHCTQED